MCLKVYRWGSKRDFECGSSGVKKNLFCVFTAELLKRWCIWLNDYSTVKQRSSKEKIKFSVKKNDSEFDTICVEEFPHADL